MTGTSPAPTETSDPTVLIDALTPDRLRLSYTLAAAQTHRAFELRGRKPFPPRQPGEKPEDLFEGALLEAVTALTTAQAYLGAHGDGLDWAKEIAHDLIGPSGDGSGTDDPAYATLLPKTPADPAADDSVVPTAGSTSSAPATRSRHRDSGESRKSNTPSSPGDRIRGWIHEKSRPRERRPSPDKTPIAKPSPTALRFVANSLAPGTLVLIVGIHDALGRDAGSYRAAVDALDIRNLTYRVSYNLACLWSGYIEQEPPTERRDHEPWEDSYGALERALRTAPPALATRLAQWASEDPSLESVRDHESTRGRVEKLLARYGVEESRPQWR